MTAPRPRPIVETTSLTAAERRIEAATRYINGRICWPDIVRYRYLDALRDLPPTTASHPETDPAVMRHSGSNPKLGSSIRFEIKVFDQEAYDLLVARGLIYGASHRGKTQAEAIDNRKAPGA